MSVIYTGGGGSRGTGGYGGSYNSGNYGRNYRQSSQWTSRDTRGLTGFLSFVAIPVASFFLLQIASIAFGGGAVILVLALSLTLFPVSIITAFRRLEDGRVAVLLLPIATLAVSFFVTGLAGWIAALLLAVCAVHVLYLLLRRLLDSRLLALVIAALPVIGAGFYVPAAIRNSGLTFGSNGAPSQARGDALAAIRESLPDNATTAVVRYRVADNRVVADLSTGRGVESVPLAVDTLVWTPLRWLERRVEGQLARYAQPADLRPRSSDTTSPFNAVLDKTDEYETVMIADGDLMNLNHRSYFQRGFRPRRVLRSFSLDTERIAKNAAAWSAGTPVDLDGIQVLDGIPGDESQLRATGLDPTDAPAWTTIRGMFERAVRPLGASRTTTASKASMLEALQRKTLAIIVVAHSDGFTIRLPNGDAVSAPDLDAVRDRILANHPLVLLLSCETAKSVDAGTPSFARVLLDHGARAVVAPVSTIGAQEATAVIRGFVHSVTGDEKPASLERALEEAQRQAGSDAADIWLADVSSRLLVGGRRS